MDTDRLKVTFLPDCITVEGRSGDTVLDVALENGIDLPHECGGNCACTTCHLRVESGWAHLSLMEPVENERLATAENRTANSRLACQALLVSGPIVVTPIETW